MTSEKRRYSHSEDPCAKGCTAASRGWQRESGGLWKHGQPRHTDKSSCLPGQELELEPELPVGGEVLRRHDIVECGKLQIDWAQHGVRSALRRSRPFRIVITRTVSSKGGVVTYPNEQSDSR